MSMRNMLRPSREDMIADIVDVKTPDAHADRALDTPVMRAALARMPMAALGQLWVVLDGRMIVADDRRMAEQRHTENHG